MTLQEIDRKIDLATDKLLIANKQLGYNRDAKGESRDAVISIITTLNDIIFDLNIKRKELLNKENNE